MTSMLRYITNPLRSTVTALLRNYLSKFVVGIRDFDNSVQSGDIVLRNLALRTEVLQEGLEGLPLTVLSATVGELHISIPWTALLSQPIRITLKKCNIVIVVDDVGDDNDQGRPVKGPASKSGSNDQAHSELISWLESYSGQILCNVELCCEDLLISVVFDETPVEIFVGRLAIVSAAATGGDSSSGTKWMFPAFLSLKRPNYTIHKTATLDLLTVSFVGNTAESAPPASSSMAGSRGHLDGLDKAASAIFSIEDLQARASFDMLPQLGSATQLSNFHEANFGANHMTNNPRLAAHVKFKPHLVADVKVRTVRIQLNEARDFEPILCCARVVARVLDVQSQQRQQRELRTNQSRIRNPNRTAPDARVGVVLKATILVAIQDIEVSALLCMGCDSPHDSGTCAMRSDCAMNPQNSALELAGATAPATYQCRRMCRWQITARGVRAHLRQGMHQIRKHLLFRQFGAHVGRLSVKVTRESVAEFINGMSLFKFVIGAAGQTRAYHNVGASKGGSTTASRDSPSQPDERFDCYSISEQLFSRSQANPADDSDRVIGNSDWPTVFAWLCSSDDDARSPFSDAPAVALSMVFADLSPKRSDTVSPDASCTIDTHAKFGPTTAKTTSLVQWLYHLRVPRLLFDVLGEFKQSPNGTVPLPKVQDEDNSSEAWPVGFLQHRQLKTFTDAVRTVSVSVQSVHVQATLPSPKRFGDNSVEVTWSCSSPKWQYHEKQAVFTVRDLQASVGTIHQGAMKVTKRGAGSEWRIRATLDHASLSMNVGAFITFPGEESQAAAMELGAFELAVAHENLHHLDPHVEHVDCSAKIDSQPLVQCFTGYPSPAEERSSAQYGRVLSRLPVATIPTTSEPADSDRTVLARAVVKCSTNLANGSSPESRTSTGDCCNSNICCHPQRPIHKISAEVTFVPLAIHFSLTWQAVRVLAAALAQFPRHIFSDVPIGGDSSVPNDCPNGDTASPLQDPVPEMPQAHHSLCNSSTPWILQTIHVDASGTMFLISLPTTDRRLQLPLSSDDTKQLPDCLLETALYGAELRFCQTRLLQKSMSARFGVLKSALVAKPCDPDRCFAESEHTVAVVQQSFCTVERDDSRGFDCAIGSLPDDEAHNDRRGFWENESSSNQVPFFGAPGCDMCRALHAAPLPLRKLLASVNLPKDASLKLSVHPAAIEMLNATVDTALRLVPNVTCNVHEVATRLRGVVHGRTTLRSRSPEHPPRPRGVAVVRQRHSFGRWKRVRVSHVSNLEPLSYISYASFARPKNPSVDVAVSIPCPYICWRYKRPSFVATVTLDPLLDMIATVADTLVMRRRQHLFLHLLLQHRDLTVPGEQGAFVTVSKTILLCNQQQMSSQQEWQTEQSLVVAKDLCPVSCIWRLKWFFTTSSSPQENGSNGESSNVAVRMPLCLDDTTAEICAMHLAASITLQREYFCHSPTTFPVRYPEADITRLLLRKRVCLRISFGRVVVSILTGDSRSVAPTSLPKDSDAFTERAFVALRPIQEAIAIRLDCIQVGIAAFCSRGYSVNNFANIEGNCIEIPSYRTPFRLLRACGHMGVQIDVLDFFSANFKTVLARSELELRILQSLSDLSATGALQATTFRSATKSLIASETAANSRAFFTPRRHSRIRLALPSEVRIILSQALLCQIAALVMAPFNGSNKIPLKNSPSARIDCCNTFSPSSSEIPFQTGFILHNHTGLDMLILQQQRIDEHTKSSILPLPRQKSQRLLVRLPTANFRLAALPGEKSSGANSAADVISSLICSRGLRMNWSPYLEIPCHSAGQLPSCPNAAASTENRSCAVPGGYWMSCWRQGRLFGDKWSLSSLPSELRRCAAHFPIERCPTQHHCALLTHCLSVPSCVSPSSVSQPESELQGPTSTRDVLVATVYSSRGVSIHALARRMVSNHTAMPIQFCTTMRHTGTHSLVPPRSIRPLAIPVAPTISQASVVDMFCTDGTSKSKESIENGLSICVRLPGSSEAFTPCHVRIVPLGAGASALSRAAGHRGRVSDARSPGFDRGLLCTPTLPLSSSCQHSVNFGDFVMLGASFVLTEKAVKVDQCLFADTVNGRLDCGFWGVGTTLSEPVHAAKSDRGDVILSNNLVAQVTLENAIPCSSIQLLFMERTRGTTHSGQESPSDDYPPPPESLVESIQNVEVTCTRCASGNKCPHLRGYPSTMDSSSGSGCRSRIASLHVDTTPETRADKYQVAFEVPVRIRSCHASEKANGLVSLETSRLISAMGSSSLIASAPIVIHNKLSSHSLAVRLFPDPGLSSLKTKAAFEHDAPGIFGENLVIEAIISPQDSLSVLVPPQQFPIISVQPVIEPCDKCSTYTWSEGIDLRALRRPRLVTSARLAEEEENVVETPNTESLALPLLLRRSISNEHRHSWSLDISPAVVVAPLAQMQAALSYDDRFFPGARNNHEEYPFPLHCRTRTVNESSSNTTPSEILDFEVIVSSCGSGLPPSTLVPLSFSIANDLHHGGMWHLVCGDLWKQIHKSAPSALTDENVSQHGSGVQSGSTTSPAGVGENLESFSLLTAFAQAVEQLDQPEVSLKKGSSEQLHDVEATAATRKHEVAIHTHTKFVDVSVHVTHDRGTGAVVLQLQQPRFPSVLLRNSTRLSFFVQRGNFDDGKSFDILNQGEAMTKSWIAAHHHRLSGSKWTPGSAATATPRPTGRCVRLSAASRNTGETLTPTTSWTPWIALPGSTNGNEGSASFPLWSSLQAPSSPGNAKRSDLDRGEDSGFGAMQYTEYFTLGPPSQYEGSQLSCDAVGGRFQMIHRSVLGLDVVDVVEVPHQAENQVDIAPPSGTKLGPDDAIQSVNCSHYFEPASHALERSLSETPIGIECFLKHLSLTWLVDDREGLRDSKVRADKGQDSDTASLVNRCCWNVMGVHGFLKLDRSLVYGTRHYGCCGSISLLSSQFVYFRRSLTSSSHAERATAELGSGTQSLPVVVLNVQQRRTAPGNLIALARLCVATTAHGALFRPETTAFLLSREQKRYFEQVQAFACHGSAVSFGGHTLMFRWRAFMSSCALYPAPKVSSGTVSIAKAVHDPRDSFFKIRNWHWAKLVLVHTPSAGTSTFANGGISGGAAMGHNRASSGASQNTAGHCPIQVSVNNDVLQHMLVLKRSYEIQRSVYQFEKYLRRFRAVVMLPAVGRGCPFTMFENDPARSDSKSCTSSGYGRCCLPEAGSAVAKARDAKRYTALLNIVDRRTEDLRVDHIFVSRIVFQVTWSASKLSSSFVSLRDAPVTFASYDRQALATESPIQLVRTIAANYLAELILMAPVLIGSLGVLGNPTAMLSRVVNVFRGNGDDHGHSNNAPNKFDSSEVTVLPRQSDTSDSLGGENMLASQPKQLPSVWASGFLLSRISSVGSRIVSELSHGAVESMVSASSALASTVDWLSMDREHAQRRQALRNDRSQLNFALQAHQAQTSQQLPQVLSDTSAVEHVDEAGETDHAFGSRPLPGSSASSDNGIETSAHDNGELGAKWSVHRTRIVSKIMAEGFGKIFTDIRGAIGLGSRGTGVHTAAEFEPDLSLPDDRNDVFAASANSSSSHAVGGGENLIGLTDERVEGGENGQGDVGSNRKGIFRTSASRLGRAARGVVGLLTKPLAGALDALAFVGEGFLFMGYEGGEVPELTSMLSSAASHHYRKTNEFDLGACVDGVWGFSSEGTPITRTLGMTDQNTSSTQQVSMFPDQPFSLQRIMVQRMREPFSNRLSHPVAAQLFLQPCIDLNEHYSNTKSAATATQSAPVPCMGTLCHVFLVPPTFDSSLTFESDSFRLNTATMIFMDYFSLQILLAIPADRVAVCRVEAASSSSTKTTTPWGTSTVFLDVSGGIVSSIAHEAGARAPASVGPDADSKRLPLQAVIKSMILDVEPEDKKQLLAFLGQH